MYATKHESIVNSCDSVNKVDAKLTCRYEEITTKVSQGFILKWAKCKNL